MRVAAAASFRRYPGDLTRYMNSDHPDASCHACAVFWLSAAITLGLNCCVLVVAGFYDPDDTSESAYRRQAEPIAFWASSMSWFALFAPIWLPSIPAIRRVVPPRPAIGVVGVGLAALAGIAALQANGAFAAVFGFVGLTLAGFSFWHIFASS